MNVWGQKCKRCPERTAHTLPCCQKPLCCSCQHIMEQTYKPFVYCPWCSAEILPFEVVCARRTQQELTAKLLEIHDRLQKANIVIRNFDTARANIQTKKT